MKNRAIKLLSYLMVICMLVTSVPMVAFAVPQVVTTADSAIEFVTDKQQAELQADAPQIKNIIYLIPDGAGYGSLDFSNDVKQAGGFDDAKFPYKTPVDDSPMTLFDYHAGSMITLNIYNAMTDSAAAGTALATGYRTVNNYLGIDRRKMPHANLTEAAQSVGKATGLVSTYEWPHATPASFAVHALQRTDYADFYRQIENKNLQVVLGNGYGSVAAYGATMQTAIDNGYTIVKTKAEMAAVQPGDKIWGNVYETSFDFDIYNGADTSTLAEMTQAAITALSGDEDGFFLMVEGSKVDTGGHSNNTAQMSSDYIAFDEAFKVAVEFAKSRNDTVVVAVPDHDTGGLYYDTLVASGNLATAVAETQQGNNSTLVTWESGSHTTQDVPFWCYYPEGITGIEGAAEFGTDYYQNPVRTENVIDNTDIAPWCASLMGVDLDELTNDLFVNVTDIGLYDAATQKFTFNNGDKYAYKDQAVYYENGVKKDMFGQMIVIEETVYVPREIIDEEDWNHVSGSNDGITGTGTEDDPFVLDDGWDFLEFTNNLIAGTTYSGQYIVQNADIDMTSKTAYNGVLSDVSFAGYYDGKGYTLNVNIDTTESSSNAVLFGINDGTIVNLGVTGDVKSASGYAAFVRKNNSNGKIVNCFVNANVSSTGSTGNGFTISNYGLIENSYFGGTASHYAIASANGTMTNLYYVEGSSTSTQSNATSVTADDVNSTLADTLAAGLEAAATTLGGTTEDLNTWYYISGTDYPVLKLKLPEVTGITVTPTAATVKRGESTTLKPTVLGIYNPPQDVVWNVSPAATSKETKFYEDGFFKIGADETVSQFTIQVKAAFGGAYTATAVVTVDLASDPVVKEDGSRTHPYLIETEEDFIEFTENVNSGNQYSNKYLKQTRDLDLDGYDEYKGRYTETYFTGIYDGDGHTINVNIYVERDEDTQYDDICLFGYISSARILNLGVTGSIKAPGYVSTFARNMSSASLIANCWSTVHVESIAKGFGTHPGNDASGFVRSPYAGAIVNSYFAGELISPGGTSHPLGGSGTDYKAVYYNCAYLGQVSFDDEEQAEITEEELEGLAYKFNAGIAESAKVATNANTKGYVYPPAMFHEWVDEIGGPRHNPRDDASRFDKEFTGDKSYEEVVIGSDTEIKADGNIITIDSLTVKEDASLHLEQGTYVLGDVTGTVTASPNANVLVTGANKPEGYVEIDIGAPAGARYAEVCGYQYDIVENDNNIYGVITDKNLIVEIVDDGGATLASDETTDTSTTSYYYVNAGEGTSTLLPTMEDYMTNYTGQSLRFADEKYKSAIRFKAQIKTAAKYEETNYVIDEYGYIITLEEKLNNNDYSQLNFDFTTPTGTAYVSGVAYNKADGVDIVFERNDSVVQFTAVFYNIPEKAYGKRIVTKTYTKITVNGEQFTLYGEPMVTSLYAVADRLIKSDAVQEGSEEYTKIKAIIDTATDNGFGNDAGADTGDLWN